MEQMRAILLLVIYVYAVRGEVDHAELRGEHPKQEHIDNGQCVPVPCNLGVPPPKCKELCDSHNYDTICQKPGDFCLCRHMVGGEWKLVSPDELDSPSVLAEDAQASSEESKTKTADIQEPLKEVKIQEQSETEPDEGVVSFQIFTVFLPIKQFYESFNEDSTPKPDEASYTVGYEPVNVHEGRLFWDFRFILTGLLLLMLGLVAYELAMCAKQVNRLKNGLSEECEGPEVKVEPLFTEKEKIMNI